MRADFSNFRRVLVFLILVSGPLAVFNSWAQSVNSDPFALAGAEYFWDTDPGAGNGVPVPITPDETYSAGYPGTVPLNVNISGLGVGLHQLGFRVEDASGRWSSVAWQPLEIQGPLIPNPATFSVSDASNQLVSAEYFWDMDPGAGNGTSLPVSSAESAALGFPGTNLLSLNISSLTTGLHHLGFRTEDASGRWSAVAWQPIQVQDATTLLPNAASFAVSDATNLLVSGEYFWDTDPGTNNATPIVFPPGETYIPGSGTLPTVNLPVPHLSLGLHYLGFRVKSAGGVWSTTQLTGVILDRRTQFNLANAITVTVHTNLSAATIAGVFCPGLGQVCSNYYNMPVTTAAELGVKFTSSTQMCASVLMHFLVDGAEVAVSGTLAPGASSGWFELGPVTAGPHLLQLQAEGVLGGCDAGNLSSWSGTVMVSTTSLSTNIAGGDFAHLSGGGTGVALADYQRSGLPGVFETIQGQLAALFQNEGSAVLNLTNGLLSAPALGGGTAVWADYDNDGWPDLFVTTRDRTLETQNFLYHNLGGTNLQLVDFTNLPSGESNALGCAWADVDNDGYVDLAVASPGASAISLYHNDGDGTFSNITASAGLVGNGAQAVAFGDFNNDGLPDLVTAGPGGVHLFQNLGANQFIEVTNSGIANDPSAVSVSWGDYDNDGWLDLFIVSSTHLGSLFHNNHDGTFTQVQIPTFNQPGYAASACAWADFDQDGTLDLFVTCSNASGTNILFQNHPGGIFTQTTNLLNASAPGGYAGCAWGDLDTNGRPDLVVAGNGATNLVFQNLGSGANWLKVNLSGRPSNRSAIGAKVRVLANIDGQSFWQMREISGGNGFASQNDLVADFGLGDATVVNSLNVEWPSGLTTVYTNVAPNQLLNIQELPDGTPVVEVNRTFSASGQYYYASLNPVSIAIDSPFQNGWIFYTTDGTTPDFTANWYTGPFQISPPATIKAIAYNSDLSAQAIGAAADLILVPTFFVTNATPGGGTVTLDPPGPNYLSNTVVTAVAANQPGWTFMNWAGDLAGTNPTNTFAVDDNLDISAVFGTTLSISALGGATYGNASYSPVSALYPYGSIPRLTAIPANGKYFVRWTLSGSSQTTLTNNPLDWSMTNADTSFIALLANLPANNYSLTTPVIGSGSVARSPPAAYYTNGSTVTLTATATGGEIFLGWSGDLTSAQNPLNVVMNSSMVITATFGLVPPQFAFGAPSYGVNETNGSVTLSVQNNGIPGMVNFSTADGTAVGGSGNSGDYVATNGTLVFAYGQTSTNITIPLLDDYLTGESRYFMVQLGDATGGTNALANPSTATVVINDNDALTTNGSELVQAYPGPLSAEDGALQIWSLPTAAAGQWHFAWEDAWRTNGELVTNLESGYYDLQFNNAAGYLPIPGAISWYVADGGISGFTNQYYPTLPPPGLGSLQISFLNNPPGAGWRLLGETAWRPSGNTATGIVPGTNYVQFETVEGMSAPAELAVVIGTNLIQPTSLTYQPVSLPSGVALPNPLASFGQIAVTSTNQPRMPYAFNGQLKSPLNGYGSGVAVLSNVVLTAAHVVFDYNTLSYVGPVYWSFERSAGDYEPRAIAARGWNVLSGYAAARGTDLTNGLTADESSSLSRDYDVAALYFTGPATRGGFGGYLSSDDPTNGWLAGGAAKMLVGYPVDASAEGYTNVMSGKMHATQSITNPIAVQYDEVYETPAFLGFGGNSGGPVYVLCTNNLYYPAAVYLGTLNNASVMRAIDSDVVDLITRSEVLGDVGTNHTGGGVITLIADAVTATNPAYVQDVLGPPAAVNAGAGWELQGDPAYASDPSYVRAVTTTNAVIVFAPVNGWTVPVNQSISLTPGAITVITNFYTLAASVADLAAGLNGAATVPATSNLTYTLLITNLGPAVAAGVTVTDALPAGVAFVSASSGGTNNAGAVTWPVLATLAGGGTTNFALTVSAPTYGRLTNVVSVGSTTSDTNLANNTASLVTLVMVSPPMMVANGARGIGLSGTPGTSYLIEYRTNLISGAWQALQTNTLTAGVNYILPWPPTNGAAAFYRAVWLP